MMYGNVFLRAAIALAMSVASIATAGAAPGRDDIAVQGGPWQLHARAFASEDAGTRPVLVVVLHGDGPPPYEHPDYHYLLAERIAAANDNVIAVGLLRPGYSDPQGNASEGDSGMRSGDNWNADNTDAIAAAIRELEKRYNARAVVVAAHSGGAAITANILGRQAEAIDAAVLVSCPCGDIDAWRANMLELTGIPVFEGGIESLSPLSRAAAVRDARITLIVGSEDRVAPPRFSRQYRDAVKAAGNDVIYIELAGRRHNIFLEPEVAVEITAAVSAVAAE
ncbi:MAG TPA: hypothetical protein VF254_08655 [Gammaproteobacteria bacterium]